MSNQTKDPMIVAKSVKRATNDAGKLHVGFSMTQEQAVALIDALTALAGNERGVKLDIHVSKKETRDGSRTFDSGICFVKAIQEFGAATAGGGGSQRFPSTPTKGYVSDEKLAAVRAKVANKTVA